LQQKHITLLEVCKVEGNGFGSVQSNAVSAQGDSRIWNLQSSRALQKRLYRSYLASQKTPCSLGRCYCSCHTPTTASGSFWSLKFSNFSLSNSCNKSTCSNYKRASIWISLNRFGIPYSILAGVDIMWSSQRSYISPSLEVKRVVSWNAPAFALLREIPWRRIEFTDARSKLVELFESGEASPVDITPRGKTLIEVGGFKLQIFMCFIQLIHKQTLLILPWKNGSTQLKLLEFLVSTGSQLNTPQYENVHTHKQLQRLTSFT